MKAMILAAGKGTRVRPLTYVVPKPMIPLICKPVMEFIVEQLALNGVKQIMVNTSHLAPVIENYFRDGSRFGVEMAYSFEGALVRGEVQGAALGSAGGLKKIQDFSGFFDETFVVLCGDALVDVDLSRAVAFHRSRKAIATLILREVPREEVFRYGVVKTDPAGRILRFQEKPKVEEAISTTINAGIYLFEPEIFDHIPSSTEFDLGSQLFPRLVEASAGIYGITLPFNWVDIGSIPDFWEATRLLLTGGVRGFSIPGREIQPGVHGGINLSVNWDKVSVSGPIYVGSSTRIGDGATLVGPTVIGSGCVIEPGATIRECILGDYTRVSSTVALEKKIAFGNRCIEPSGTYLNIDEAQIGWIVDDARKVLEITEAEEEFREEVRSLVKH